MGIFTWICILVILWHLQKVLKEKVADQGVKRYAADARRRIIEGVAGMLSKIAKADGHVCKAEVDVAEQFLKGFQFTPGELEMAKMHFNLAMDSGLGIDYYARRFASVASVESCRLVYEMLWMIAAADGHLDPAEDRMLRQVVSELGFADSMYHFYRREHLGDFHADQGRAQERMSLEKAYAKLGCSPSDSDDDVRAAYRKQAMRYHPDRLRAEGLPEGMLKQANRSMAEINAAWDLIRESRARC